MTALSQTTLPICLPRLMGMLLQLSANSLSGVQDMPAGNCISMRKQQNQCLEKREKP